MQGSVGLTRAKEAPAGVCVCEYEGSARSGGQPWRCASGEVQKDLPRCPVPTSGGSSIIL